MKVWTWKEFVIFSWICLGRQYKKERWSKDKMYLWQKWRGVRGKQQGRLEEIEVRHVKNK